MKKITWQVEGGDVHEIPENAVVQFEGDYDTKMRVYISDFGWNKDVICLNRNHACDGHFVYMRPYPGEK